eukprot:2914086-Ditylum_brightwellii.AAC.1
MTFLWYRPEELQPILPQVMRNFKTTTYDHHLNLGGRTLMAEPQESKQKKNPTTNKQLESQATPNCTRVQQERCLERSTTSTLKYPRGIQGGLSK